MQLASPYDVLPGLTLYEGEVCASLAIPGPCDKVAFPVAEFTSVRDVRALVNAYAFLTLREVKLVLAHVP